MNFEAENMRLLIEIEALKKQVTILRRQVARWKRLVLARGEVIKYFQQQFVFFCRQWWACLKLHQQRGFKSWSKRAKAERDWFEYCLSVLANDDEELDKATSLDPNFKLTD